MPSSASATSGIAGSVSSTDSLHIPLIHDSMTFENRQTKCLKDLERQAEQELKRKKREWEREVEKMKEEFFKLHCGSIHDIGHDPFVFRRKGSIEVLDLKKLKTMITEGPDCERKFRLRFDINGLDPKSVKVNADHEKISIKAYKKLNEEGKKPLEFWRYIAKPKEVDPYKLKCHITSDCILIIESSLIPKTLNLQKKSGPSPSHSFQGSKTSRHSKTPPPSTPPSTPQKDQKIGVPIFTQEEDGQRKMHLTVDVGCMFKPKDITIQVIKENRILVKAKNEERTSERLTKMKFTKEFELAEKIESYSIRGGLTTDGKLIIGAFAKGYGGRLGKEKAGKVIIEELKAPHSSLMPCNILNLASFPPTMPASASQSNENS